MENQEPSSPGPRSAAARRWSSLLADRALLIAIAIAFSAAIGGFFWFMNRKEIFGDGRGVTMLLLLAYCIYSRIRINRLEKKLKEHGLDEPIFPVPPSSPPN